MSNNFATITLGTEGEELSLERELPHPPTRVWAALTEPDQLGVWLMDVDVFDLRVGGGISFEDFESGSPGEILALDPPNVFEFTWTGHEGPPSVVRFELTPSAIGTTLRLHHRRLPNNAQAIEHAAGWHTHVELMEAMLDSNAGGEFWTRFHELHELYMAAAGA